MPTVFSPYRRLYQLFSCKEFFLSPYLTVKRYFFSIQQQEHFRTIPNKVVFFYELTEMRIICKFLLVSQNEYFFLKIVYNILSQRVKIVFGYQILENISVSLVTLYLVHDNNLGTIGAFLAIFVNLLRNTFKMLTVKVHKGLSDRLFLPYRMLHRDVLLVVCNVLQLFLL